MADSKRPPGRISGTAETHQEEVLVVPRDVLQEAGLLPTGFRPGCWKECLSLVAEHGTFLQRDRAEEDTSLKQIIPYAVVTFDEQVFVFRRTSRGAERRLHLKLSIGVGGHVQPEGVAPEKLVEAGLVRELEEELSLDSPYRYDPIGLINDDREAVGQVHLGIVYRVQTSDERVKVREEGVLEGGFLPIPELRPLLDAMESWSRLVAKALYFP